MMTLDGLFEELADFLSHQPASSDTFDTEMLHSPSNVWSALRPLEPLTPSHTIKPAAPLWESRPAAGLEVCLWASSSFNPFTVPLGSVSDDVFVAGGDYLVDSAFDEASSSTEFDDVRFTGSLDDANAEYPILYSFAPAFDEATFSAAPTIDAVHDGVAVDSPTSSAFDEASYTQYGDWPAYFDAAFDGASFSTTNDSAPTIDAVHGCGGGVFPTSLAFDEAPCFTQYGDYPTYCSLDSAFDRPSFSKNKDNALAIDAVHEGGDGIYLTDFALDEAMFDKSFPTTTSFHHDDGATMVVTYNDCSDGSDIDLSASRNTHSATCTTDMDLPSKVSVAMDAEGKACVETESALQTYSRRQIENYARRVAMRQAGESKNSFLKREVRQLQHTLKQLWADACTYQITVDPRHCGVLDSGIVSLRRSIAYLEGELVLARSSQQAHKA